MEADKYRPLSTSRALTDKARRATREHLNKTLYEDPGGNAPTKTVIEISIQICIYTSRTEGWQRADIPILSKEAVGAVMSPSVGTGKGRGEKEEGWCREDVKQGKGKKIP